MQKKIAYYLYGSFLLILTTKVSLSFLFHGPTVFPDEGCIIETAKAFATNLQLIDCKEITHTDVGNPPPILTIIFSIFYLFLKPISAYHAILIFHSFLISTLIFPLYKIFKKFIKEDFRILPVIALLLFIPELLIYEKSILTETLFAATNVWFLHFYIESFSNKKTKNKIIALLLAITGTFLRPFGFIMLFSMFINEIITNKNKKNILMISLPVSIAIIAIIYLVYPQVLVSIFNKASAITNFKNIDLVNMSKSLFKQFNSLNITTLSIPLIVFIAELKEGKLEVFNKIKFYLTTFIISSLIIGSHHIYNFEAPGDHKPDLLFRYINVSIIYVLIFSIIFILKKQKFELNRKNLTITCIVLASTGLIQDKYYKLHLIYEYIHTKMITTDFFSDYYIFITIGLLIMLINNKWKSLLISMFLILITHSTLSFMTLANLSNNMYKTNDIYQNLKDKKSKILYLIELNNSQIPQTYWALKTLTENETESAFFKQEELKNEDAYPEKLYHVTGWRNKPLTKEITIDRKSFDYTLTDFN